MLRPHSKRHHHSQPIQTQMPNALERSRSQSQLKSINRRMPSFPATVVMFSKQPGNLAFEVILFEDQFTFDRVRVRTVAAMRVVTTKEDLADVPVPTLGRIYANYLSRQGRPATETELAGDPLSLVYDALPGIAIPFKESTMSEDSNTTTAPASTKADALAAERKAKREEKAKAKADAKAAREAKRGDGVIGTIKKALDTKSGTTQEEILTALTTKFPDRTREGMTSTVKIQFSRLQKSTGRTIINAVIEGRGRVYKFEDQGPVPGKIVEAAPKAETPAEPKAAPAASTPATPAPTAPVKTTATTAATTQTAKKTTAGKK